MAKDNRYRIILGLTLGVTLLDQFSKWRIAKQIPLHGQVELLPFLNLVHVYNRGAAFGFLNRSDIDWQFWFFLLAAVIAAGVIFFLARGSRSNPVLFTGLGLILGGALGNMIDRVRMRAVLDFVDFHLGSWHFAAFNVADSAITIGAVLAIWAIWRLDRQQEA